MRPVQVSGDAYASPACEATMYICIYVQQHVFLVSQSIRDRNTSAVFLEIDNVDVMSDLVLEQDGTSGTYLLLNLVQCALLQFMVVVWFVVIKLMVTLQL